MKTIALRFADNFAPADGTIAEHNKVISELGYVWYGKLGSAISQEVINELLNNPDPKFLLIHSGKAKRYWAHIVDIQRNTPTPEGIPSYYREQASQFKTWFKVVCFEDAPSTIVSRCKVVSSQRPLSEASKRSMSPYFIIEIV